MKKALGETQTLWAGRSKAEPKIFARRRPLPWGAGRPKFNQLEMVIYLHLQTQFVYDDLVLTASSATALRKMLAICMWCLRLWIFYEF